MCKHIYLIVCATVQSRRNITILIHDTLEHIQIYTETQRTTHPFIHSMFTRPLLCDSRGAGFWKYHDERNIPAFPELHQSMNETNKGDH